MENNVVQMNLVGFFHFKNKEGTKEYHIIQCVSYPNHQLERGQMKGVIISIFVDLEIFQTISNMSIGDKIDVEIVPNLETGKINYKVMI